MRRFGILSGVSMAFVVGACAIGTVGCNSDDESSMPDVSSANSGVEARAIGHVQFDAARALVDANQEISVHSVVTDVDGGEHVHFNRTYKGLRVIGGDFIVHGHVDGSFRGVSRSLNHRIDVDLNKNIGEDAAIVVAQAEQTAFPSDLSSKAELVVHAREAAPALAYEVIVHGVQADQTPSELHVIVDAESGDVIEKWEGIETAAAAGTGNGYFVGNVSLTTNSNASTFELKDPSRGNLYTTDMKGRQSGNGTLFAQATNAWGDGNTATNTTIAVDAQFGTAVTWDYYKLVHGRNGIANNGVGAFNRVHYGRKYNNAFWSDSCFCMTYGDGDGTTFNPFDSLDVAGHEMTHGVTSKTANLTYSGESGGLNESTSDIFGTMVEFYANNAKDTPDWNIGEMLYKSGTKSLRYMNDPDKDGVSKGCWYSTIGSIDVHYSSGVGNLFFYLLVNGGKAPARPYCNTGITVSGIARADAEKIWYRALTVYMTSSTKYAGARAATLSAATDLFGAGSAQSSAVAAAWSAVNVN